MKTVKVYVVDDNNKVIQDNLFNLVKTIKETNELSVMLVADNAGDIAIVRAMKDYSVTPYRLIVKNKLLFPFLSEDEDND